MREAVKRYWFLCGLLLTLATGFAFAEQLKWLVQLTLFRHAIVFSVMFVMAWSIRARHIGQSLRRPKAPLLASGISLVMLPLLAWPLSLLLNDRWAMGLIITAATPCTLASAVVWTRRGGGNDVTALMTTLLTNLVCFVVTPAWIRLLTSVSAAGKSPGSLANLILVLLLVVVLPIVLAQLSRLSDQVARWASAKKTSLGVFAQFGILAMVLLGAIQTGLHMDLEGGQAIWLPLLLLAILVSALHFAGLFGGIGLARAAGCKLADQIAVGISGSQKTLMVGLTTCLELEASVLPILIYHTLQLTADTVVADRFRKRHFPEAGC